MIKKRIATFERLAQNLIEGSFSRFLGGQLEPQEIASKLAAALEESVHAGQIANVYRVYLHPRDLIELTATTPSLAEVLSNYLIRLSNEADVVLPERPLVSLLPNGAVSRHHVEIEAEYDEDLDRGTTRTFNVPRLDAETLSALQAVDAFLIVEGQRHVPLTKPLITIGRRTDNDVVLDSGVISRKHAQIQWKFNHFILYDLGSRAGTFVNGQQVEECVLRPGDVIKVGTSGIIYGESASLYGEKTSEERAEGHGDTVALPPLDPSEPDRE